jgi:proliferating cell nuclear antigen
MKLTIATSVLKEFFSIVETLATELRLHIDSDKIWYRTTDTANVAMAYSELASEAFTVYNIGEPLSICIDLAKFKNVFQMKGAEITIESVNESQIIIYCGGYDYKLALLNDATVKKDPGMPQLELPGEITINGGIIGDIIKIVGISSDKPRFILDASGFRISSKDIDEVGRTIAPGEAISMSGNGNSMYSIDYLKEAARAWGNSEITIQIGNDFPIIVSYQITRGKSMFLLAPRIQDE